MLVMICIAIRFFSFLSIYGGWKKWTSHLLVLPSPSLREHAVSLPGDGIPRIVEHFLDLRQRDLSRIVVDVDGLRRDIDLDLTHAFQFANSPLDRALAMLARNVRGDQCRR